MKEAHKLYEKAHALMPDRAGVASNLARLRRITGTTVKASTTFRRAFTTSFPTRRRWRRHF